MLEVGWSAIGLPGFESYFSKRIDPRYYFLRLI
jgi:hypothetical protein